MTRNGFNLLVNHIDAWGVALGISLLVLILHDAISLPAIVLATAVTLAYWLGFAINDYYDSDIDRQDPRKAIRNFFASSGLADSKIAIGLGLIAVLIALVFLSFGLRGLIVCILGYAVMWAYSAPPLRLKNRPVIDLLTHSLFVETYPYFVMLFVLGLSINLLDVILLGIFMLTSLTTQLEQQIRDYTIDRQFDLTFAVRFGPDRTDRWLRVFTALLLIVVFAAVASGQIPTALLPFGLIMLPILLHRLLRQTRQARSERLVRLSLLLALLYTGVLWAQQIIF